MARRSLKRKPSIETRSNILDSALELFNEHGTARITTNHIAEHVGISPGNLYYHYSDKAEIIRDLVERWLITGTMPDTPSLRKSLELIDFIDRLSGLFKSSWTIRFFFRDIVGLVQQDESLLLLYRKLSSKRIHYLERLLGELTRARLLALSLSGTGEEDLLAELNLHSICWIKEYDLSYEGTMEESVHNSVRRSVRILLPHLAPTAKASIKQLFPEF